MKNTSTKLVAKNDPTILEMGTKMVENRKNLKEIKCRMTIAVNLLLKFRAFKEENANKRAIDMVLSESLYDILKLTKKMTGFVDGSDQNDVVVDKSSLIGSHGYVLIIIYNGETLDLDNNFIKFSKHHYDYN